MNVILGSSGFIGKHLLHVLPNPFGISVRNKRWKEELNSIEADSVINLVGKAHDHGGSATEEEYDFVNLELTKEIFFAFINCSAKLLIHISSIASVEEFNSSLELKEENECHPISFYGKSKRKAEEWLIKQELPTGKKLIVLRPPMVHGPGDKGNLGILFKFVSRRLPYPLSSFNNRRSFISIDNFTFFIENVIEKSENLKSVIYHISDDEAVSTNDIIFLMEKALSKSVVSLTLPQWVVKLVAKVGDFVPLPLNTKRLMKLTGSLIVSNKKLKEELHVKCLPLTALEGLEKTIKSLK